MGKRLLLSWDICCDECTYDDECIYQDTYCVQDCSQHDDYDGHLKRDSNIDVIIEIT